MTSPKQPLVVGGRVCAYYRTRRIVGVIESIDPLGCFRIIEDGFYSVHEESPFHPKQVRRLIKFVPRKKAREYYLVRPSKRGGPIVVSHKRKAESYLTGINPAIEVIHVREVLPKKGSP